tara:strand:+ start:26366 stop:26647 length:282 start_codon:yes stop_codon:yes gene_type:complete
MKMKDSGWAYYIPEHGEDKGNATPICTFDWQAVYDADDAAKYAAEDDWDNRDGWEAGVGDGPTIVIVSPDGAETYFSTEREAVIEHRVTELAD